MRTLILCGGRGTRAYPYTLDVPKPLLAVGGRPVLGHVMAIYAAQGFTDFVLAAGYRSELIREFAGAVPRRWRVEVVDTGQDANTGERVSRCMAAMGRQFFLTYADGLGNVDLHALLAFHRAHEGAATLTTVPLPSQYGTVSRDERGKVDRFVEKPRLEDHWINAGFFVFEQAAAPWCHHHDLERGILPSLAAADQLYAYRHTGFWRSLDTYKEALELSALCEAGSPPWSVDPTGTGALV